MRRVSSQAMTSASRSADSTRRVMSSRFPIGVGQTTSRPPVTPTVSRVRVARRAAAPPPSRAISAAPSSPASAPNFATTIRTASRPGSSARSRTNSRARARAAARPPRSLRRRSRSTSGLKMFTSETSPTPRLRPISRDRVARHRIALLRELGDQRPGQLPPLLQRLPERCVRPARDRHRSRDAPARCRSTWSPGSRSWGSPTGTAARSMSTTMCPISAPPPSQPR